MSKVLMEILGLSTSPSSGGAYALILTEAEGNQRLPIIIGSFEAQAIALELENIKPPRPMTHDLLKNFFLSFDTQVKQVFINDLSEGTFYAQIIFERENQLVELDARPSDAIALAVRFNAPIYVNDEVLKEAGISTEPESQTLEEALKSDEPAPGQKELTQLEKLEKELQTAIETENYEKAAKIRDRISKMKG
ncbi:MULTISPECIES: bifunctional nuclease family protein [Gracilimonas]|uniref:Bifunctional nuclease family protein n=1 Tax=Gracilimonas sediminicola TaxID=2952158 RepID=A0A9X2RI31_9BACT|nr:bifunctional nuclease family protein [Gracilimonas sediminicola]MCP9292828.1 bifunctional nuclease family protein [Gracilimonas sediminicola]